MNNRKSFIIHKDSLDVLDSLTDEEAGKLFKAIKEYQLNGFVELEGLTKIIFSPFKGQFERDEEKYKKTCEARAVAGSKGGKQKVANATNSYQKVAKLADSKSKSDSDSDSDSKNDSKSDREKKESHFPSPTPHWLENQKNNNLIQNATDEEKENFDLLVKAYGNAQGRKFAFSAYLNLSERERIQAQENARLWGLFYAKQDYTFPNLKTWLEGETFKDEPPKQQNNQSKHISDADLKRRILGS